jgi:hypothetical protein
MNEYEGRYGPTIEVSVDSLLDMPEQYVGRAVRTRGQFDMIPTSQGQQYGLRGTFGGYLYIFPRQEVVSTFEQEARRWSGKEVEVQGSIDRGVNPDNQQPIVYIAIWGYLAPPDDKPMKRPDSPDTTLEDLVTKPERYDGKTVNVRGVFRGENLFGDLPSASRDKSSDWVIKDDVFAVWVSGRKPKGDGFELDAGLKRDTNKWLQVVGLVPCLAPEPPHVSQVWRRAKANVRSQPRAASYSLRASARLPARSSNENILKKPLSTPVNFSLKTFSLYRNSPFTGATYLVID